MNLFQHGEFTLNSGATSKWKLECDALTEDDWEAVAEIVKELIGPFVSVEGVPRGGLKLAEALAPFANDRHGPHLIVDDVLTTGGSMERLRATHRGQGPAGRPGIVGVVLFARGKCPEWIRPLFQMPEKLWIKR